MKSVVAGILLAGIALVVAGQRKPIVETSAPGEIVVKLRDGAQGASTSPVDALRRRFPRLAAEKLFKRFPSAVEIASRFSRRAPASVGKTARPELGNVYRVDLKDARADVEAIARELQRDPRVVYAEPNYLYHTEATTFPNDPYFYTSGSWGQPYDDLWGLKVIQAPAAWKYATGKGVVVAVIDTGVDYNHADIKSNIWINPGEDVNHNGVIDSRDVNGIDDDGDGFVDDLRGWDFVGGDSNPMDDFGHGTHVAGTIAAIGNNQRGIIGVAYEAKILPVKSLGSNGSGTLANGAAAIVYAANRGADVINMSWGGPSSMLLADAVTYASSLGAVLVAAAGNGNADVRYVAPAKYPEVIAVAATDHNDRKSDFSNWGDKISVAAPGGDNTDSTDPKARYSNILSLKASSGPLVDSNPAQVVGKDCFRLRGTSASAPHAAAVAALILSRQPSLTPALVRAALEGSADDLDGNGFDLFSGYGRVNALEAMHKADEALVTPELFLGKIQPSSLSAAPGGPLGLTFTVQNPGRGDAADVDVEVFDGDPALGGTLLDHRTLPSVPAGSSVTVAAYVTLSAYGPHTLYVSVDRRNGVPELNELNNSGNASVEVSPFASRDIAVATQAGTDQMFPDASDDRVVWQDFRNGDADIYLFDLRTARERRITTDPQDQALPVVSGNVVAWQDLRNGHWDIYSFDLVSGLERRITSSPGDHTFPSIDGSRIVWEDTRNGNSDIYLFDLSTGLESRISTDPSEHHSPVISGDRIVWIDDRNGNPDVWLHDLSTGQERPITTDPGNQYAATIQGERIVWEDHRSGNAHIYLYDLAVGQERQITFDPGDQYFPSIYDERVVYEDAPGGSPNIYLFDLAIDLGRAVTSGGNRHYRPSLSSSGVAWQEDGQGSWDVYANQWSEFIQPPTNLRATAGAGEVLLGWDVSFAQGLYGYAIYRNSAPGGGWEPIATTRLSAYDDVDVTVGVPYSYRVSAINKVGGEGPFSSTASATP